MFEVGTKILAARLGKFRREVTFLGGNGTSAFIGVDKEGNIMNCLYDGSKVLTTKSAPILRSHGPRKIEAIRCIREFTGLGLREAKDVSERLGCPLPKPTTGTMANFVCALRAVGAKVVG